MEKFKEYFQLDEYTVVDYVRKKTNLFNNAKTLIAREIGDGNLNYVYRICDENNNSIIVKQAGKQLRISSEINVPLNRGKQEYEACTKMDGIIPNITPVVYFYDEIMCVIVMEDMKTYKVMREELLNGKTFDFFSDRITDFLSALIYTTDIFDLENKKENVKKFTNPFLCKITEDLVFTYPYFENSSNIVLDNNRAIFKELVFDNNKLKLEVEKLKYKFMNYPQALIHGDLHTGSIFINSNDIRIFDFEFSFYGPIGYDIGNVIANIIFSLLNSYAKNGSIKNEFISWGIKTIEEIIDKYVDKFTTLYAEANKERDFADCLLDDVLSDTAGYTGTELIRRIIGMAKVKDITEITDMSRRINIERIGILIAEQFIINRHAYISGKDYSKAITKFF